MLIRTVLAVALLACRAAAQAHAPLVDVTVTDRVTGERAPVSSHRGERWIAGTPGNRYSITLHNRSPARVLAVLSIDGVNAISGQTAAWDQAGYVLGPGERAEVRGWRKSEQRIAAFEFTALPDSYAARTGRPEHVGVIGVALFREWQATVAFDPLRLVPGPIRGAIEISTNDPAFPLLRVPVTGEIR